MLVVKIKCGVGNPETPMNAAFLALYATFFPWPHIQYGWKQAILREPSARFPRRLCSALAAHSVSGLSYPVLWSSSLPTGPWLSTVCHPRVCKRYYGLIRQSDELRPAWASSAYSGRSLPVRAVRLTFPSLLGHTVHTCNYLYPVGWLSSFDGSSLSHASLHPSYPGSAVPRNPPHWLQRRKQFRGGSLLVMLRPACWLERLTSPCRQLAPPTRPPVYGRACPGRGLPQPGSAMTTRPNHPLPRQVLHLQVYPRSKAAHR